MEAPTRPALRYHGGKWKLAPWIISRFPAHRVYVEAFGGGGSVLLRKQRCYREVYNDIDGQVVNLFKVIRDEPKRLQRALEWTPFSRAEYYTAFEVSEDPIEQARRTVVRSFMGFSNSNATKTGFRSVGGGNREVSRDWVNLPPNIMAVAERMQGVSIECKPAIEVKQQHDSADTLHYDDPPYVHATRETAGNGYRFEMTDEQHEELVAVNSTLKGMVIVSGYHSDLYDRIYADWHREEREAFGDGACERVEVLWFNERAWDALHSGGLFSESA